jgi:hypothetical protein
MDVHDLLTKLQGVRGGKGSWSARCPAHADRSPSFSVKELPDGRILMHCFGGCGTDAVLGALGLTMSDLFPEPLSHHMPAKRGVFTAMDALRGLERESAVLALAAADMAEGKPVDQARLAQAAGRVAEALEFVHGH